MPIVGGRSVRTCLQCGNPYCGPGNGSPGPDCPANKTENRRVDIKSFSNWTVNTKDKDESCTCKVGIDICCPKHGYR